MLSLSSRKKMAENHKEMIEVSRFNAEVHFAQIKNRAEASKTGLKRQGHASPGLI